MSGSKYWLFLIQSDINLKEGPYERLYEKN